MMIQMLTENPLSYFRLIVITIVSICLHELAHGIVAIGQGDNTPIKTGYMKLDPIVLMGAESIVMLCLFGIAWGAMPVNPNKFRSRKWGDLIVSAAGPVSNAILGLISVGLLKASEYYQFLSEDFFFLAAIVNFNLFLFNCLPIPPLDGFYIFSKFFPGLRKYQNTNFSLIALMLLMFFGIGSMLSVASGLIIDSTLSRI
jgi:Zn-dependent protease